MATLVARKGLNPEAPEFVPRNSRVTLGAVVTNLYLPPSPIFSPPNTSFYYPSPSLPYLPTFPTPLLSQPPYPNQPSLLTPHHHTLLPSPVAVPASSRVNETPYSLTAQKEREGEVEQKVINTRGVRIGLRNNRWFWRRSGGREGFGRGHGKKNKQVWKPRLDEGENQFLRMVEYSPMHKRKKPEEMVPVQRDENKTTVMIRNIPNKYTRKMLLHFVEEHCLRENKKVESEKNGEAEEHVLSAIDFLYLPMDFKTGMNKSYAFVNFTDPRAVWKFHLASHNQKWELFHSSKIREIACAKIQGREALIKHFEHSAFACDSEEYLPVSFSPPRDGSGVTLKQNLVGKRIPVLT